MAFDTLDRVFLIVFARYRRKLGSVNVESAWLQASNKVSGYLVLPLGAAIVVAAVLIYATTRTGTLGEHKKACALISAVAAVLAALALQRRFKKYLSHPPPLAPQESRPDQQYVFWFRFIAAGIFVLVCATGFILHQAGFRLL